MSDKFEDFLKNEIGKSAVQIPDDGFSGRVISKLSKRRSVLRRRELIIIIATIFSGVVLILINGFNLFVTGIMGLISSIIQLQAPNYQFVIVLVVFSLMSLAISFVERERDLSE